jgi:hypothetical protein
LPLTDRENWDSPPLRRRPSGRVWDGTYCPQGSLLKTLLLHLWEVFMSTICEEVKKQQDVPDLVPVRMLNEFA